MCEDKRVLRHVVISDITDNLNAAVRNLENFADEIEGFGEEPKDEVKKSVEEIRKNPSMSQFLVEYPKRIEALNARITETTNRLKELLF